MTDHTLDGLDCWCCPVYYDAGRKISRREACAKDACGEAVVIVHRSEVAVHNDVTGPIPWMPTRPTEAE